MRVGGFLKRMIGVESDGATLAAAAEANGFEVIDSDDNSCCLLIEALGYRVGVSIVIDRERDVLFTFFSTIKFPPDRLPESICKALDGLNRKEPRFLYIPFHGREYSKFAIRTFIPRQHFSKDAMGSLVREVVPRVTGLDEYLEENGYAR